MSANDGDHSENREHHAQSRVTRWVPRIEKRIAARLLAAHLLPSMPPQSI